MATLVQDPRILLARIHMSPEAGVEVRKLWVWAKEHGYCCLWHSRCLVNASSSYSQNPLRPANVFFSLTRFIFIVFRLRLPLPVECHPNRPCPAPVLLHFQSLSSNNRTNAPGSWQSTVWILDTGCWMLDAGVWILESGARSVESGICSWQLPVARRNAFNFYGSNGVLCTISTFSSQPKNTHHRRMCADSYALSSHRNCTLTTRTDFWIFPDAYLHVLSA